MRGRQKHLLEEFHDQERRRGTATVEETCSAALKAYVYKNLPLIPSNVPLEELPSQATSNYGHISKGEALDGGTPGEKEAKIKMHLKTILAASKAMILKSKGSISLEEFENNVQDILLPYLDSQYGSTINASDHSIFSKLTKKFEDRFMEDVRALNCVDPDEVTRVTEYGQQIVEFVAKVQENGFAYPTSDGSVYFDIEAFEAANNHYARLEPWNRNDKDLQADGEGALTKKTSEKRSDADFALWKSSKPGEPSWPSPWGDGRPGWHIECSAMASDKLGSQIDIHSGGIDLAFPHHDNELAQSEAFWTDKSHQHQHQWVNYFIHMGHLSIQGSKMSKSLKNFTTIREALSRGDWTARSLRITFLHGGWKDGIEITDDLVKEGSSWEDKVNVSLQFRESSHSTACTNCSQNFFIKAQDVSDNQDHDDDQVTNSALEQALAKAKKATYDALCDSFNTSLVMRIVSELITQYNSSKEVEDKQTLELARWVTSMVNIFGLNGTARPDDTSIGWSGIGVPEIAKPWLTTISRIRDTLRQTANSSPDRLDASYLYSVSKSLPNGLTSTPTTSEQDPAAAPYQAVLVTFRNDISCIANELSPTSDTKETKASILALCDRIRDIDLWSLGIYLEDRDPPQGALIRPITPALRAAKAEADAKKVNAEAKKLSDEVRKMKIKEDENKKKKEAEEKAKVSEKDMFRTEEWSEWDGDGVPTKDKEGAELGKSRRKKLRKEWERQERIHRAWVEEQGKKGSEAIS